MKSIIGTIIIVGIVVIIAVYFMTATPAKASTINTNTLNNTSSIKKNANLNGTANSQNNANNNQNTSNQSKNTKESNNVNYNNQAQSNPIPISKPVIKKPTINTGTGNFDDILSGATYLTGIVNGSEISIPLKGGHIVNNMLVLSEYYINKLNETFTVKIASLGNNNFTIYEYYNGNNTSVFKLKYHSYKYGPFLSGTFTQTASNAITGVSLYFIAPDSAPPMTQMPFYHTIINGTPVTIISSIVNRPNYYEKYAGDNNIFTLNYKFPVTDKKYQNELIESYNGEKTGEYLLNQIPNTGNSKGLFIIKPGTSESKTYNVTLTGNFTP
ncbi:hypothetical protein [uncultured Clostridium sp.]|uniref:hypothetical protein n=1 Tax=uncultured Clostridium sp. TaxID=59620 RepID=UPI00260458BD|nr:hypothetical protein [uncultured Clostridium sp.]